MKNWHIILYQYLQFQRVHLKYHQPLLYRPPSELQALIYIKCIFTLSILRLGEALKAIVGALALVSIIPIRSEALSQR